MRNSDWSELVSVAGRILLGFLFVFSQSAWAGVDQKTNDQAASAQRVSAQHAQVKQTPAAPAKAQNGEVQGEGFTSPSRLLRARRVSIERPAVSVGHSCRAEERTR
jgi:hypothetical protein